ARHRAVTVARIDGLRLLVVEDDAAVLSLIELALEGRGARVTKATSDADIDRLCAEGVRFDAALLDLSPVRGDLPGARRRADRHAPVTGRAAPRRSAHPRHRAGRCRRRWWPWSRGRRGPRARARSATGPPRRPRRRAGAGRRCAPPSPRGDA